MLQAYQIAPQLKISGIYSFFKRKHTKDFIFTGESHNFHEVVCVLKGSVSITAGSKILTLSEGSVIWHPPMEFHSIRAANGTAPTILVFSFSADVFPEPENRVFSFSKADEVLLNDAVELDSLLFERDVFQLKLKPNSNAMQVQRFADTLTLFLLRIFSNNAKPHTTTPLTSAHSYTAVTTFIHKNLPDITCVEQVADACGLSIIGVQKLFHKYAGIGMMRYVNYQKISRAIAMLKSGKSNKETAQMLGFSNQNYFSTVFKRITGLSPSQYIKQSKTLHT